MDTSSVHLNSECAVIGRSHAKWVASRRMTQFASSVTDHSADEMGSVETKSDDIGAI